VTILADAVRDLFNGTASASAIGQSLLWALAITVVFAPLSVWKFKRRI
jgi:oleandomycin transport system permease protein